MPLLSSLPMAFSSSNLLLQTSANCYLCKGRNLIGKSIISRRSMSGTLPQVALDQQQSITQHHDEVGHLSIQHIVKINQVKCILRDLKEPLDQLVMIDHLQRLCIDHYFFEEIDTILRHHYKNYFQMKNIFDVSLRFQLLRGHKYYVCPDVFCEFKDEQGRFKSPLVNDVRGMMTFYEATKLLMHGEEILDEANDFASKSLKALLTRVEPSVCTRINHVLSNPFHLTIPRFNVEYQLQNMKTNSMRTKGLQELARMEFYFQKMMHREELKEVLKWWTDLSLTKEVGFARDQITKWFMWSLAILPNSLFSRYRVELTKVISFIYVIDDVFDIHGTLDELLLFTNAINRWDPSNIDYLPGYMRVCFMALYDITNEIACMVLKEHQWNPINSFKRAWGELCNAFLIEAKWFASSSIPTTEEYIKNGAITSGVHVVLVHAFFLLGQGISEKQSHLINDITRIISSPARILRLWDDLGSAKDENQEGRDGSYVDCYMKEHPTTSNEYVKEHVRQMIMGEWKSLNNELMFSPFTKFSPSFVDACLNFSRMIQIMYDYDKDHRLPSLEHQMNLLLK